MTKPSLYSRFAKVMAALQTAMNEAKIINRELEKEVTLKRIVEGLKPKQRPRKRKSKK